LNQHLVEGLGDLSLSAPERQIEALRSLAMRKFLETKQSDDLRRDIASELQLSDGLFFPGDKVYYWTEDKSKIKSDGSHGGKWIKGKLVSVDGSMSRKCCVWKTGSPSSFCTS